MKSDAVFEFFFLNANAHRDAVSTRRDPLAVVFVRVSTPRLL